MLHNGVKLKNVDPELVRLVLDAAAHVSVFVIQGARTVEEEKADIAAGRSSLKDPLNSKHVITTVFRPLAEAVDLVPYDHAPTPEEWKNIALFERFGAFVKQRAAALRVPIVWGGDWAHFRDYDHFEKVEQHG